MTIEIMLDPKSANYSDVVRDLQGELRELKRLEYKEMEVPAPPQTLNVEHDVIKFIFDHGPDAVKLIIVLVQLLTAVTDRNRKGGQGSAPAAMLKVNDRTLAFPAKDRAQRNFLDAVRKGKTKRVAKKIGKSAKSRASKKKAKNKKRR